MNTKAALKKVNLNGVISLMSVAVLTACPGSFDYPLPDFMNKNSKHDAAHQGQTDLPFAYDSPSNALDSLLSHDLAQNKDLLVQNKDLSENTCNSANCNGCCDAKNTCVQGTQFLQCGKGGVKCQNCSLKNLICEKQTCVEKKPSCHWPFDNDVRDAVGNNDGTNFGSTFVSGKINQAVKFTGPDPYILVPKSDAFSLIHFTIVVWVKIPSAIPSGWRTILEHDRWGDNWYGLWKSNNGNTFHFRWSNQGIQSSDFSTVISPDTWYQIVASYSDGTVNLYLNGSLEKNITGAAQPAKVLADLYIGRNQEGNEPFEGVIDDLRIYNYPLTKEEIKNLYNAR